MLLKFKSITAEKDLLAKPQSPLPMSLAYEITRLGKH